MPDTSDAPRSPPRVDRSGQERGRPRPLRRGGEARPDPLERRWLLYEKALLLEDRIGQRKEAQRPSPRRWSSTKAPDHPQGSSAASLMAAGVGRRRAHDGARGERRSPRTRIIVRRSSPRVRASSTRARRSRSAPSSSPDRVRARFHGAGRARRAEGLLYAHERWRDLSPSWRRRRRRRPTRRRARCPLPRRTAHHDRPGALDEAITRWRAR